MAIVKDHKFLAFLLGISSSMLLVFPGFRPSGLPLAYILLICLLIIFPFAGIHVFRNQLGRHTFTVWALPILYLLFHTIVLGPDDFVQHLARNGIGYIGGVLIFSTVTNQKTLGRIILGMAPIMLLDSLAGIGQYFNYKLAFDISKWVASYSQLTHQELVQQSTFGRIFGLHILPHNYAYDQGVWVFIVFWYMMFTRQRLMRIILMGVFLVALLAVLLSSQRSMVWMLIPSICLIYVVAKGITRGAVVLGLIAGSIIFYDLSGLLTTDNTAVLRLSKTVVSNADTARWTSWESGLEVIATDPFVGTAFKADRVSIHNGLLNGWARYGILWAIGFVFGFIYCAIKFYRYKPARTWVRYCSLALLAIMFMNSMFHTLTPARNDITFFIVLGFIVALFISESSRNSTSYNCNKSHA